MDAAVCLRSWTRRVGIPIAVVAVLHCTDRFQFDSRSGPPSGAAKIQSPGPLSAAHRSTIGVSSSGNGTVLARPLFTVSTYSLPPPPLARIAR
jgi:hypothetical protein